MRHNHSRRKGSILVLTLWVLALMSLMAFAMVERARHSTRSTPRIDEETRCRALLTTLAQWSMARLAYDEDLELDSFQDAWGRGLEADGQALLNGFPEPGPAELDVRVTVTTADESGKINVNDAPPGLLIEVLRVAGAEAPESIAAAIADWRDADNLGAFEADAYAGSVPACVPPNEPLKRIEELLFVRGVTPGLFFGEDANHNGMLDAEEDDGDLYLPSDNADGGLQPGLMDLLTVHAQGALNPNTCSKFVLDALLAYANSEAGTGVDGRAIVEHRQGPDRLDGTADDRIFEDGAGVTAAIGEGVVQACASEGIEFELTSTAVRFHLRAEIPSRHIAREADLLVLREGQELRVLEWHDGQ